jgi:hypothetical protein
VTTLPSTGAAPDDGGMPVWLLLGGMIALFGLAMLTRRRTIRQ